MERTDREELIYNFLKDNDVDIEDVIDVVIKENGFIGVGLERFETYLINAVNKHHKKKYRRIKCQLVKNKEKDM